MTAEPVQGDEAKAQWDLAVQHHLLEHLIPDVNHLPNVLYHYTTGEGLAGILRTRTMWATHIGYLNDATEFQHGLRLVQAEVGRLKQQGKADSALIYEWAASLRMALNVLVYVAAFSTDPESLPQWRAYARPFGFALGLDMSHVLAVAGDPKDNVLIYPCVYEQAEQDQHLSYGIQYLLAEFQKRTHGKPGSPALMREFTAHFMAFVLALAASFKHPAFKEEREWRLVARFLQPAKPTLVRRARRRGRLFVPYLELPLATGPDPFHVFRIVVGPTPDYDLARQGLEALLEETKTEVVEIVDSRVPFRDWQ